MDGNIRPPKPSSTFNWHTVLWILLVWLAATYLFQTMTSGPEPQSISYSAFKDRVREGRVAQITMKGNRISGSAAAAPAADGRTGRNSDGSDSIDAFQTIKPDIQEPDLMTFLETHDVVVTAESQEQPWLVTVLVALLPWLLIIGFFVYMSRRFRERMGMGGVESPFGFAKSKAKRFKATSSQTTFEDVAGLENAKKELQEIIAYLKDPARFQALGGELPKGVLLVGPPGVGKTLLAQAVAGEADTPFFSISGSEFIEMFVGVGASRVRDMFTKAKSEAPALIFIDELDSIGRMRGSGLGGGHDEREQTLNQILAEMDGFTPHESVVVLAATNRPDVLDPALVRPGRFDRRIALDLPGKHARRHILATHTRDVPVGGDVDLSDLAARTVGFSGADLKNLVNEAALLAARRDKREVDAEAFELARDKIMLGIERDEVITDEEKETIAFHEAGHALVAWMTPNADPLQKVTIIPRGGSLGATEQTPGTERYTMRRHYLLDRIAIMLAGRAAERLVFEDVSTGAGDDLKNATQLARRMVCQWGMSDALGPVAFQQGTPHPFLGRELAEDRDFSEHTARLIDDEVKRITHEMEVRAGETLEGHRGRLDALAAALLEHETLTREQIDDLLNEAADQT